MILILNKEYFLNKINIFNFLKFIKNISLFNYFILNNIFRHNLIAKDGAELIAKALK